MLGFFAAAAMLFGVAGTAQAADVPASPTCCTFAGGPFTQAQGDTSSFINPVESTAFHNLTSSAVGPDGKALFESETITPGASSPVAGSQYLAAGSYPFVCTLHPGMDGDLVVDTNGTPVARPGLKLVVLNQKLKQVRKTGRIKFKATALGETAAVKVAVKRGKKLLVSAQVPKLAAGTSRTINAKLTNAGRKAMKTGKKVPVSLSATIPFGKAAKANRTIR